VIKILDWHSILFVPAHEQRFITKAHTKAASAIALDFEDSVPSHLKQSARVSFQENLEFLGRHDCDVCVRVNLPDEELVLDLNSVVRHSVKAIVVPKVSEVKQLALIDSAISKLEAERGLEVGGIPIIAMIESVAALIEIDSWTNLTKRLAGLLLGTEDLSLDAGMEPTPENLFYPAQLVVLAAKYHNLLAFGFPDSIADYSDNERMKVSISKAKALGYNGAFCIHPNQVTVVNEVYDVSTKSKNEALEIVEAFESAVSQGKGAIEVRGKMVDFPVYERARKILLKNEIS